jgi:hypothetical protein
MKKVLLSSALFLISFIGFSQTKGISYQAVIIDPNPIQIPGSDVSSQPYVSKEVWIRFGIYAGTTLQYEELHKTKTDEFGLVNLIIGAGVNTGRAGTFTSLSWDGVTKNILTNVSFDQGGRYAEVSNQKLSYTPYTLLAETAVKLAGVLPIASGGTGATTLAGSNIAVTNAAQTFTGGQRGAVTALTSSAASIAINLATNNNFSYTTSENSTLAAPSNPVAGQSGVIVITQGATAYTLAYNTFYKFAGGTVPTLTATAGAVDTFAYYVESASRATCQLIKDVK